MSVTENESEKSKEDKNIRVQHRSINASIEAKIPALCTKVSVTSFNPGHRVNGGHAISNGMSRKASLERHSELQL